MADSDSPSINKISERVNSLESIMIKLLQSFKIKDAYGFFLDPVDTSVITDYTTVIKQPMDLGTMEQKLSNHEYHNLREFQNDFELICSNAMVYNAPNTIYYRSASKLLTFGRKVIARESLKWNEKLNNTLDLPPRRRKVPSSSLSTQGSAEFYTDDMIIDNQEYESPVRKAKTAFFKKLNDSSLVFSSSIRPTNFHLAIKYKLDGSVDIGNTNGVREVLLNPYHENFSNLKTPLLGSSATIISNYISTKSKRHTGPATASILPGSLEYNNPFTSFSPFYDTGGYAIASFENPALGLAYGDPKGKAYIESLEVFLSHYLSMSGNGFLENYAENLCDSLTMGGHSYVKNVEEWKHNIFISKKKDGCDDKEVTKIEKLEDEEIVKNPLHSQVKNDLNQLARILRWKRIEPEFEKLVKSPPNQILSQFIESMSRKDKDITNLSLNKPTKNINEMLSMASKLIFKLQSLQNERFKSIKAAIITNEEKALVKELKTTLIELSKMALPEHLIPSVNSLHSVMQTMTEAEVPVQFCGTLVEEKSNVVS